MNFLNYSTFSRPPPGDLREPTQNLFTKPKNLKTKGDDEMKNYQSKYYKNYYAQNEKGEYIPVSRKACFSPAEPPTEVNPYKQRWFYDEEAGYAVRLERSELGEKVHRSNDTSLKREERYKHKKFSCVWKDTTNCDQDCDRCNRKNTSRTVEMDKTWTSSGSDEMISIFEPVDESQNIVEIIKNEEFVSILNSVLDALSPDDKKLFDFLLNKEKKKIIAESLNITVDGVRYRELQLRKKLLSDKQLKDLLEMF